MVAFGMVVVGLAFVLFGFVWIYLSQLYNPLITNVNVQIAAGKITQQAADAISFQLTVREFIPVILMFGIGCWFIVRALETPSQG